MNMMTMAKMEEAIEDAFKKPEISLKYSWAGAPATSALKAGFEDGFRAGAAWAMRQAKKEGSSQAVGNISQYPAAVEEPEEEV